MSNTRDLTPRVVEMRARQEAKLQKFLTDDNQNYDLSKLSDEKINELCENGHSLWVLLTETKLQLDFLLGLDLTVRTELFEHCYGVSELLEADLSLDFL